MFKYIGDDERGLIAGDGSANSYDLMLPYDHKLVRIAFMKPDTSIDDLEIRYIVKDYDPDTYYETLYDNDGLNVRNVVLEPDNYEGLGGAMIRINATLTNGLDYGLAIMVQFLERPN